MTETLPADTSLPRDTALLGEIARKTLWLSTAIVDAANRGRPNSSGVKVGGHESSSASMQPSPIRGVSCRSVRVANESFGISSVPTLNLNCDTTL